MDRRKFLAITGSGVVASAAGCLSDPVDRVDELPRPVKGDPDSDVVVQVFEDLGCPACARYNQTVQPTIEDEYVSTDQIRYEHYDYVIPANPRLSSFLNNAARGVQDELGQDEFWDFIDWVFENQTQLSTGMVSDEVAARGITDPDSFVNVAQNGKYKPVIDSDQEFGSEEYNVSSTPTVVVSGQVVSPSAEVISSAIDVQLEQ